MVLEISSVFGDSVDGITGGSPIGGILKSPYGMAFVIIVVIMFIWYIMQEDELCVKGVAKAGLYMFICSVIIVMVHDHLINADMENTLEEEEVEQIMPKPIQLEDNVATLERIRNSIKSTEEDEE